MINNFKNKDFEAKIASNISNHILDGKKVLDKIENYIKTYNLENKIKDLLFPKIK